MAQCPFGEQQKSPTLAQGLTDLILTHATEIENTKMQKYEKDKCQTFFARIQWPFSHGFNKNKKSEKNYENLKAQKYYLWHKDSLSSSICRADLIHMHATKMFQSLICFQLEHKFAFIFQRDKIIAWIELSWRLIPGTYQQIQQWPRYMITIIHTYCTYWNKKERGKKKSLLLSYRNIWLQFISLWYGTLSWERLQWKGFNGKLS